MPAGEPVCVLHSFVVYQFTKEERDRLSGQLEEAAARRPLCRIAMEGHVDRPDAFLAVQAFPSAGRSRLAFCDPHGSWIEWLPPET
jgi:hypothetical protein